VNGILKIETPKSSDTTMTDVEKYIHEIHNIDPVSDLFRYPFDKRLKPYFVSPRLFDIDNVSSCFKELCNFLNGVDCMFSAIKEFEDDMVTHY
jgi:hypothetical protein